MLVLQLNPSPVVAGERKLIVVRGAAPVRGVGARRAGASRASGEAVSGEICRQQSQVYVVLSKAGLCRQYWSGLRGER